MGAPAAQFRQDLSAPGLFSLVRETFSRDGPNAKLTFQTPDVLMSALAMFSLKIPSLLEFDGLFRNDEPVIRCNLEKLFGVKKAPSDTRLRERLDQISPELIRHALHGVWQKLQRGKALEPYKFFGQYLIVSFDGTGHFSSSKISCPQCCVKKTKEGDQFYHQLEVGSVVHPDVKAVLPIEAEPITRADGDNKNDCERNASKRALIRMRKRFTKQQFLIVEDALAANAPHLELLHSLNMAFVIGVKFTDHAALAMSMQERQMAGHCTEQEVEESDGSVVGVRIYNDLPLNKSSPDCRVNVLEFWSETAKGKKLYFSWVSSLELTLDNAWELVRAGRARWKIENETFNTLKNQGYNLEHNYGHGEKHLATNLGLLCLLAFLIDQTQLQCCRVFAATLEKAKRMRYLQEKLRAAFLMLDLRDWTAFYGVILGTTRVMTVHDTG